MVYTSGFVITLALSLLVSSLALAQALPFSEQQLSDALAARAPDIARADVHVQRDGQYLLVSLREQTRVVDVADLQGAEAARVVALVVADLALAPLPLLVALPAARDRDRLALEVFMSRGLAREETFGVDAGAFASHRWRSLELSARPGYWSLPAQRSPSTGRRLRFDALSARAGCTRAAGALGRARTR